MIKLKILEAKFGLIVPRNVPVVQSSGTLEPLGRGVNQNALMLVRVPLPRASIAPIPYCQSDQGLWELLALKTH